MIELNGIKYELKYNLKRIELIEAASKKPLMSMLGSGFLTISDLTACVAYGLRSEGADNYLPTAKGMEVARKKIEEDGGYMILSDAVAEAFERDCPFFFRVG